MRYKDTGNLHLDFHRYCDHCIAWIGPVMDAAGLYAVNDMISRQQPRCILRVYTDRTKAAAFEKSAELLSTPYARRGPACPTTARQNVRHDHDPPAHT